MQVLARFLTGCVLGATLLCASLLAQAPAQRTQPVAQPVAQPLTQSSTQPAIAPPKIDKPALIKYLRYAEGFTPTVAMTIDDPKPSIFSGFYEVLVRLKMNKNEAVRTYYLTQDGQRLVAAPVFDLHKSPFITNLRKLEEGGAPAFGPAEAPVKIYAFSDFECPYCREEAKVLREGISKEHANQVRIIFKNFPLESIHPWARSAAISGVCIARQNNDKFWSFHDWVYEHQTEINPTNLRDKVIEFAKTQSLDIQKLSSCIDSSWAADEVNKTVAEARNLGIVQTPTLFVNGRMVAGALVAGQVNLLIQIEADHRQQESASVANTADKCCEILIPTVTRR
jgi:protein-disulfide isomerase